MASSWAPRPHVTPPARRTWFGQASRGIALDMVTMDTADGHTWDGLLFQPARSGPGRWGVAVLVVHGSVGNYITGIPRRVSFALARAGFTVLSVNTRMANYGVFFGGGLLQDTPLDLDPALALLERRGFRSVVLCGYSLGATIVSHYQALRQSPSVAGVLTLAHPLSLPASLRRRWERFGAEPGYDEVAQRARAFLTADHDRSDDRIFVVRRATGPTDRPVDCEIWTYRTWWHSRGPEAPHAVSALQVPLLRVPLGLVQGGSDPMVPRTDGEELARRARAGGCPAVRLVTLAGADHGFSGHDLDLGRACVAWLEQLVGVGGMTSEEGATLRT